MNLGPRLRKVGGSTTIQELHIAVVLYEVSLSMWKNWQTQMSFLFGNSNSSVACIVRSELHKEILIVHCTKAKSTTLNAMLKNDRRVTMASEYH